MECPTLPNDIIMRIIREATASANMDYWTEIINQRTEIPPRHANGFPRSYAHEGRNATEVRNTAYQTITDVITGRDEHGHECVGGEVYREIEYPVANRGGYWWGKADYDTAGPPMPIRCADVMNITLQRDVGEEYRLW